MKATGFMRTVDKFGRVVVPIELRESLSVRNKDALEVTMDGDMIVFRKCNSNAYEGIITRHMDHLGRVTIPAEIRKRLDLKNKDSVELFVDGDNIIYRKYAPNGGCALCGEVVPDIAEHGRSGKEVCALCASEFRK